jgi:flagellar protein FliO/FliZ
MPGFSLIKQSVTAVLLLCIAGVTAAADAVPFAAPVKPVISDTASSAMRVPLALLLVLALVLGAAWLMRRATTVRGGTTRRIQVLAQVSLGARERAVLINVAGQEVLLGVAPGSVRTLLVTPASATADAVAPIDGTAPAPVPSFAASFKEVLRRSLGQ